MPQVDKDNFNSSKEPAGSPSALFEKHMCGGRDYDTLLNDFEADMFAVRRQRVSQRERGGTDREGAGVDDLGDAEVEARDAAAGGAGEGFGADVPAIGGACGEDPRREGAREGVTCPQP